MDFKEILMTDGDWSVFEGLLTKKEFMCRCGSCGEDSANNMKLHFMTSLYALRRDLDKPFKIHSGYRCEKHPREAAKIKKGKLPGDHFHGVAADIGGSGNMPVLLVRYGFDYGFNVFGWDQKGAIRARFTHIAKRSGIGFAIGYTY